MAEDRIEVDTGTGELLCEIRDRVALITLNRPEARNALSDQLTPALRRTIRQCGDGSSVGALLITVPGPPFAPAATSRAWGAIVRRLKRRSMSGLPTCVSSSAPSRVRWRDCESRRSRRFPDLRRAPGLRSRSPATFESLLNLR
jgi:hypothetical protein